ncbi:MAG: N-acetylmuramoyl-L-alanine amidase [Alphaproteobacteria bacterium]|nr:N-acetylmuramoyl-L-alanine amidase [Alphaproteobacteria bacterium]
MPLRFVDRPSPNHDARPPGAPIDMLVLHYTGMKTAEEALERLCDPAAKVSAHYTVDRDGTVYAHVPEERRAWHAGVSFWAGESSVNACSLGIELVNPGHEFGYVPFTDEQIASLIDLARDILARHPISARRVLGHSDVAPARKTDPGELFPWRRLAEFGVGIWPAPRISQSGRRPTDGAAFAANLTRFGYGILPDVPLEAVAAAFQRRFRPSCIDGIADDECAVLLEELLVA